MREAAIREGVLGCARARAPAGIIYGIRESVLSRGECVESVLYYKRETERMRLVWF